ncbi:hypothetical protein J2T13_000151 [Paenibacillus sp. DS2015]
MESVSAEYLVRIDYAKVVEVVKQAEKPKVSANKPKAAQ